MIGEDRILSAFWLPGQKRFCELVADEIKHKSGLGVQSDQFKLILARGLATYEETNKNGTRVYRLTRDGEAAVTSIIVAGNLPKPVFRLTGVPTVGEKKWGR